MVVIFASALIVFAAVACGIGFFSLHLERLAEQRRLLAKIRGERDETEDLYAGPSPLDRVKRLILKILRPLGSLSRPKSGEELNRFQKRLVAVGCRKGSAAIIFFGSKGAFPIVFVSAFLAPCVLFDLSPAPGAALLISLGLAAAGFYAPEIWFRAMLRRRKERLLAGLPDALDLLVICVESGMGLDAAIARVGQEMALGNRTISEEFKILLLELRAGKSRRDALRNFAARMDLDEVNSLVSLLIQTDRFGTSVAQSLRVHSDSMRVNRYQQAEERAAKMPVKLIVPLVLCIFPALFLVILGPALIQIWRVFKG